MSHELIESLFAPEEESKRFKFVEDIDEKTGTSRMKIQGVCQRADHINLNNRVYPKKVLESALSRLSERILQGRGFGELDHPLQSPSLKNTAHLINDVWWDDKDSSLLCCEVTVLDTPHGQVLKEIVRAGGRPGFSSRGTGEVERVKMGEKEVDRILDGFDLTSFDFVIDPSVQPAQIRRVMESAVQKYVTEGAMDIKTVDDLRKHFPDLVKEVEEKIIEDAEKVVAQELEEKNKQLAKEVDDLKAALDELKKQVKEQPEEPEEPEAPADDASSKYTSFMNDLVDLLVEYGVLSTSDEEEEPEEEPGAEKVPAGESKEVDMTDEEKKQIEDLKAVVTSLESENQALKAKVEANDKAKVEAEAKAKEAAELAEAESKKSAELEEQKKVATYLEEKLSGFKYANALRPRLEGCKTVEEVDERMKAEESFIKSLEEQFGKKVPAPKGKTELEGKDQASQAVREQAKKVAGLK